jgi:hypothetical protein
VLQPVCITTVERKHQRYKLLNQCVQCKSYVTLLNTQHTLSLVKLHVCVSHTAIHMHTVHVSLIPACTVTLSLLSLADTALHSCIVCRPSVQPSKTTLFFLFLNAGFHTKVVTSATCTYCLKKKNTHKVLRTLHATNTCPLHTAVCAGAA